MPIWILWLSLLVGLLACSHVQGQRISQTKCEEYINGTMTVTRIISMMVHAQPVEISSYNCSKTVDLIVGGEDAKRGEFRHQALLGWKTNKTRKYLFQCGGTLISERYVLTAAHCMYKSKVDYSKPVIVRFAELDLKRDGDEFDRDIESFTKHPNHRFRTSYHDIALVRLKQRVRFSDLVRPACLWADETLSVSTVIATGFGKTDYGASRGSDTLRKVQLEILDSGHCDSNLKGLSKLPQGVSENQLCIGSTRDERDTCQGDSGGPIQVLVNPRGCIYHVIAITSQGSGCNGYSAVYTKVAPYLDWIESIVWPSG